MKLVIVILALALFALNILGSQGQEVTSEEVQEVQEESNVGHSMSELRRYMEDLDSLLSIKNRVRVGRPAKRPSIYPHIKYLPHPTSRK